jgi:hypothetical protein
MLYVIIKLYYKIEYKYIYFYFNNKETILIINLHYNKILFNKKFKFCIFIKN